MESDQSESSTQEPSLSRQSGVTLGQPESKKEMEEEDDDDDEGEQVEDKEEEINDRDDESLPEDNIDGQCFSTHRQQRKGSNSSSGGSFEELQSPTLDESTSTVSEDVEELESSLEGSLSSSFKQRSLDVCTQ